MEKIYKNFINITLPITKEKLSQISAGTMVKVTGYIYTGRDKVHTALADGSIDGSFLTYNAIYHCGPVIVTSGDKKIVISAGPTTSLRMEKYMPTIIEKFGPFIIIGKGGMGQKTLRALQKYGGIYIQTVGGTGCLLAETVKKIEHVFHLKKFGSAEAIWQLYVEGMEGIVTMDMQGQDIHAIIRQNSKRNLERLLLNFK